MNLDFFGWRELGWKSRLYPVTGWSLLLSRVDRDVLHVFDN